MFMDDATLERLVAVAGYQRDKVYCTLTKKQLGQGINATSYRFN